MGDVVVSSFVTLDGVIEGSEGPLAARRRKAADWSTPFFGAEMSKSQRDLVLRSDVLLLSRVFYVTQAVVWPFRQGDVADRVNNMPKYVVSTTLDGLEWHNARLINKDVATEIRNLKGSVTGDILVCGGQGLVHTLRSHRLIDRYQIWVHPVVAGSGKRLFDDGDRYGELEQLQMVDSRKCASGVVALTYKSLAPTYGLPWPQNGDYPI